MSYDHAAYMRAWRARNRERLNAWFRSRHHERKSDPTYIERRRVWARASRARRRDARNVYNRAWRAAHPELRAASDQRVRARSRERRAYYQAVRHARQMSAAGSFTFAEWRAKVELLGGVCLYCGEAKPLTIDHKVPLVRGGSNDVGNVVPACGSCNSRKGTRTADEFLTVRRA